MSEMYSTARRRLRKYCGSFVQSLSHPFDFQDSEVLHVFAQLPVFGRDSNPRRASECLVASAWLNAGAFILS